MCGGDARARVRNGVLLQSWPDANGIDLRARLAERPRIGIHPLPATRFSQTLPRGGAFRAPGARVALGHGPQRRFRVSGEIRRVPLRAGAGGQQQPGDTDEPFHRNVRS